MFFDLERNAALGASTSDCAASGASPTSTMLVVERSVYRTPASCQRGGFAGVVFLAGAVLTFSMVSWHWVVPALISSARPSPRLAVFDIAPAAPDHSPPLPHTESRLGAMQKPARTQTPEPMALVHNAARMPTTEIAAVPAPSPSSKTLDAPPTSPPAAPATAPPVAGAAPASERSARANWQGDLLAHLKPLLRYPRMAQNAGQQGVTLVAVTVERDGAVRAVRVLRGSGYPVLDQEAVATIKRGAPLPPPTADILGDPVSIELPIQFSLRT